MSRICIAVLFVALLVPSRIASSQASQPVPMESHETTQADEASAAGGIICACMLWGFVGLLGAGAFGAYLRGRPTAWIVVGIWYSAAYFVYYAWTLGISMIPPLLAIAISVVLGPVAKVANDEAVREGRRKEDTYQFTSRNTLSMAFNFITLGLWVSLWWGWDAWNIFPGLMEGPVWRKLTVGIMLVTGLPMMMWIDTLAHGGFRVLRSVPIMAALFLRCRRGRILLYILVVCICYWHSPFAKEPQPLRWEMTVSLVMSVGLLWLQPPYVLMLGASSEETGAALGRLANAAFPFRIVALLDRSRTGWQFSPFSWWTDDLRTVNESDWRWVVDHLIEIVPTIVLDARTTRPVVVEETERLLRSATRLRRATFVIADGRIAPALTLNGVQPTFPGLRVVREAQIETVLSFAAIKGH